MCQQGTGYLHDGNTYRHDMHLQYMLAFASRNIYIAYTYLLISVIRISYCKINLYECPINIQGRLGLGVAYVAIFVKVSGSSLGEHFFSFFFFFFLSRHEQHKGHAMIFMCDKTCQTAIWTETMASDNNRPLNSKSKDMVYSLSGCCLKIKKRSLSGSVLRKDR